jgi:nitrate reductase cytochrome c-type subunit
MMEKMESGTKDGDNKMANEMTKTCPKCPSSVMKKSAVKTFLPAMTPGKISQSGIPVCAYQCLQCHLVELYYEEN